MDISEVTRYRQFWWLVIIFFLQTPFFGSPILRPPHNISRNWWYRNSTTLRHSGFWTQPGALRHCWDFFLGVIKWCIFFLFPTPQKSMDCVIHNGMGSCKISRPRHQSLTSRENVLALEWKMNCFRGSYGSYEAARFWKWLTLCYWTRPICRLFTYETWWFSIGKYRISAWSFSRDRLTLLAGFEYSREFVSQ
jgi:hypothetical protein